MIFNEVFFENRQATNERLYVRQAGELLSDPDYSISRVGSATNTVGVVRSGKLRVIFGENRFEVLAGQSVFLPRDAAYSLISDRDEPPRFLWVNLRGKLIDAVSSAILDGKITVSKVDLSAALESLKRLIESERDCFDEMSLTVFKMILEISRHKKASEPTAKNGSEYELYISNSVQSGFSVKSMAEYFHCSTDTLNRIFLRKYGETPYKYYQKLRMEIAATMLRNTELTVDDIAERLKFADRNHFTLCFKRTTGMSPVKYRKNGYTVK